MTIKTEREGFEYALHRANLLKTIRESYKITLWNRIENFFEDLKELLALFIIMVFNPISLMVIGFIIIIIILLIK